MQHDVRVIGNISSCVVAVTATVLSATLVANCASGGDDASNPSVADDVDALVWAYGLMPSDSERTRMTGLYEEDIESAPHLRDELASLRELRETMRRMDTLQYIERWAVMNSELMRAQPGGQSTRYAHEAQNSLPGSRRYCASESVVLSATTRAEFTCGGYRFAVMADSPRGYPAISYAPYDNPKGLQRLDWRQLRDRFQVVAEPDTGGPIAMRRVGMELFISVAPPR